MPAVVLQHCPSYEPEALDPALDALLAGVGGLESFVRPGQSVMLKPNLISDSSPEKAATTHPALLEALARRVLALGATPLIADAPAWGAPEVVARTTGVRDVCDRLGLEFVAFKGKTWLPSCRPAVAAGFHVDPRVLAVDVVINVPKFKSHQQTGFTGALKNLYGCVSGREKAWHHCAKVHDDRFARFLVSLALSLPVSLHVMDGVLAMEGYGPRSGPARWLGALGASVEPVALDTVFAELTGATGPHRLLLDAARELGLGETDLSRIAVTGTPSDELRVTDFDWPPQMGVFFSPVRLAKGWLRARRMRKLGVGLGSR